MAHGDTRDALIQAAGQVVLAKGAGGLTLAAVAREAGVSKGGLLYHFASKDALLAGMVEQFIALIEARIAEHTRGDTAAGSWTRGYLAACAVDPDGDDPLDRLATAVLAAGATSPELLDRLRARQTVWHAMQQGDGLDPATAAIVRLAADGLWLNDLFGIAVVSAEERETVLQRLREMTRP